MSDQTSANTTKASTQAIYQPSAYDELLAVDGQFRLAKQPLSEWLTGMSANELSSLNEKAVNIMYRKGVTFTVYGEGSDIERVIPFDIVPRVISPDDWQTIESGCIQRITALNAFIHDIYHGADILRAGIIPSEVIFSNTCFEPWMLDISLAHPIYAHISGIDLIRDDAGNYLVLEDNLRTPSGVSYMIESRALSESLIPDVLENQGVCGIEQYPQLLKQCLIDCSGKFEPKIVVLSPGRFNSAYYEHAFLAREMDVPLVSGHDLIVQDNQVYIKSVCGKVQVDVIYRRLDDDFLDPLAFKPDGVLGVAGLMGAYRAGNVMLANAPGTGVADDKSIYPYVPKMIEFYLGQKPILNNVETYLCGEKDALAFVLDNLENLVVKEAQGSGGYGMLIGPKATKDDIATFRKRLIADPSAFIAQPTISLSTCPTAVAEGLAPRHIDLRPFVLSSPDHVSMVAGGLTRVAMRKGSLVVNSSQGGGVKDTWVLAGNTDKAAQQ